MEIREIIQRLTQLQDSELLDKLETAASIRQFQKGDDILRIGEMQTKMYLLLDGIVRGYFLDGENLEHTDCFMTEFGYPVMTASISFPSLLGYVAVTPVHVIEFPMEAMTALMAEYTELLWMYNAMLQKALFFHWEIKASRVQFDAVRRYVWFLRKWPDVEKCANSKHIASFLAMTPETLSRSRRMANRSDELLELLVDPSSEWDSKIIKEKLDRGVKQDGLEHRS